MTTLRVSTTIDTSKIEGAAKQVPFALSLAIAESLKKAQAKQREKMAQEFTIRRKDFLNLSVKITKFPTKNSLVGELAIKPPGDAADIFGKFELGGTKRPKDGHDLAIPVVGSLVKKTKRTIIADQNRPKALLSGAQTVTSARTGKTKDVKRAKSFGGAFLETLKNGTKGIFLRVGKKIQLAYLLKPKAQIKPELHFVDTVSTSIKQTWPDDFAAAFAKAMATRKR